MSVSSPALERWHSFVDGQQWERGYLDHSSYCAFLRAGSLGIDPQEAIASIAHRIRGAGDHLRLGKLNQQARRAYSWVGSHQNISGSQPIWRAPKPEFIPEYARQFAQGVPSDIGAHWLRRHSPVKVPHLLTPAEYLHAAYDMGDQVLVFTDYRSQGQELWEKYAFRSEPNELRRFVRGHAQGVWFLANPVDGHEHFNERQQKMSRRSEESITAFRYAVLESDCQALEQWLRILVQLPLPIVSITLSGSKSAHALVRIEATSKADWDQLVGAIKPRLINLGTDIGALTAVRLTRLPGCYRGDRLQELLYLNAAPTGDPIWKGLE
jgi:hypothetical protein